jgi:hypothetical protein
MAAIPSRMEQARADMYTGDGVMATHAPRAACEVVVASHQTVLVFVLPSTIGPHGAFMLRKRMLFAALSSFPGLRPVNSSIVIVGA